MARKMTEDEMKRYNFDSIGVAGTGPESSPEIASETVKTLGDAAASFVDDTLFGFTDEILETLDEDKAREFRERLATAKEESPFISGLAGFFSPNPASKLKTASKGANLASKAYRSLAPEAATSALYQLGRDGELSAERTVGDVAGSKLVSGVVGKLAKGDRIGRRSSTLGSKTRKSLKDVREKSKRLGFPSAGEYIDERTKKLENLGLFNAGSTKFNPETLKFEKKKALSKVSPLLPPSDKIIDSRLQDIKDSTGKKLESYINSSPDLVDQNWGKNNTFLDELDDELDSLTLSNPSSKEKLKEEIKDRLKEIARDEKAFSVKDLYNTKKELYSILGGKAYQKVLMDNPDKAKVYIRAASVMNEAVERNLPDKGIYRDLNKLYGEAAEAKGDIARKIELDYLEDNFNPEYGAVSTRYGLSRFLHDRKEDVYKGTSQITEPIDKNPLLKEYFQGVGQASSPRIFDEERSKDHPPVIINRSPDSAVLNIPRQLRGIKIPRSSEWIQNNPKVFLAKIAQRLPDEFPMMQALIESRPEDIGEILPRLSHSAPFLFEKDEYGRIDGIVHDPLMKQKAREDIYAREDLNAIQKAQLEDKLNRTGKLPDLK